ncbi:hypothetical protein FO519_006813 [Halicephalobus sp. NKZ332]|nr:hypothetical protein FO519_006813 [Halicephalobus sp. NKZ332]
MSEESSTQNGTRMEVVPEYLKNFILTIVKTFYGPECYVVADYIQRNVCVKEEKLRQFLKFDPKSLKPFLAVLKVDKVVKERIVTEEIDGKQRKVAYYYINYKGAVNITKYKLDQIRQKLESREKDQVNRSQYKCNRCQLKCWNCFGEVRDEETTGPSEDTRSSLAKFNEQTGPLVTIMQNLNGVIFAEHILEPPVPKSENIVEEKPKENEPTKILKLGERSFGAAGPAFNPENMKLNLGDTLDVMEPEKEAVPWLTGSVRISLADVEKREAAKKSRNYLRSAAKLNMMAGADDEEIENLLEMEKDRIAKFKMAKKPTLEEFTEMLGKRSNGSNGVPEKRPKFTVGDDDEEMEVEENGKYEMKDIKHKPLSRAETLKNELTVTFGSEKIPVTEVTEEILEQMTKKELERVYEAREKLIEMLFRCEW